MDQVGQHRVGGRRMQARIHGGVDHRDHLGDAGAAEPHLLHDLALALQPVGLVGGEERRDVGHRRSVGRPQRPEAAGGDLVQAGVVGAHVAVRRADHGGGPAHHMVA